jgi:ATP-binding cassette subfamily B protein
MPSEKLQKNIIYPKVKLKDIFEAFWRGIKPQKWLLFSLIILIIFVATLSTIVPIFYQKFFDIVSPAESLILQDRTTVAQNLLTIIFQILGLNIMIWIIWRLSTFVNNTYQTKSIALLKQQAYDYLMKHSYSFFTNNFAGSLVQKVNRFARAFERISDRLIWDLLPLFVRTVAIVIVVFFINKWIASIILIWALIFILINIILSKWKLKYDIQVAATDSKTTAYLSDTISNQNTIQLFGGFVFESLGYKKVTNEQAKITKFTWDLDALIEAAQSIMGVLIQFLLFFFAIKYWQQGTITVGIFVLFQVYIITLIDQLWGFNRIIRDFYQSYADTEEMIEIMLLSHDIKDAPQAKELVVKNGEIEFKDLNFNFNETRKVLENINLKIKAGEKVALIGPSGAGKTTFVRLLLRLYSATSGKILIDGQEISEVTQESLRRNISMVPQDPILFHRTLAENIAYGKRGATENEIKKAAILAHCDEFIKNLPYGLETYVGERGIKLSGGERQRVAIARAILKNAPILVLDEATSSLDSNSEMLIQDALNNLMKNKTTIVIAHRLSTIQKMDRIIVIDGGKIIEQGSHLELLKNENSLYKKLWELQAGGFLEEDDEEESEEEVNAEAEGLDEVKTKMANF